MQGLGDGECGVLSNWGLGAARFCGLLRAANPGYTSGYG